MFPQEAIDRFGAAFTAARRALDAGHDIFREDERCLQFHLHLVFYKCYL
jgi:hypothetical protein